jgi:peptide-methionine (S)-S-oxide reductase
MFLFSKPSTMVTADVALPGRDETMPVPAAHEVLGNPIAPPFPEGLEQAVFGLGCLWGAERIF